MSSETPEHFDFERLEPVSGEEIARGLQEMFAGMDADPMAEIRSRITGAMNGSGELYMGDFRAELENGDDDGDEPVLTGAGV